MSTDLVVAWLRDLGPRGGFQLDSATGVLYLWRDGSDRYAAYSKEHPSGHVERYDADDRLIGVTLFTDPTKED